MNPETAANRTASLNAPNTCRDASTSTSAQHVSEAALDVPETILNKPTDMPDRAFRPELVRTGFYDRPRVAHYNIVDNNLELLAQMNLAVPAGNLATLNVWEDQLREHIEVCWQLAANDTGTAMRILSVTLGQIPGYGVIHEPRLTYADIAVTRTGGRHVDPPIPHLRLPNSGWL